MQQLTLGIIPRLDDSLVDQLSRPLFDSDLRNEFAIAIEHALDVGQQHELLGAERTRDCAGGLVCIDVVGDAVLV